MTSFFPKRTVHLDFHNGPDVPGIGSRFDAARFADTFLEAGVDSVTLFAKCHHGHLYYDTARPERHPGLAPDDALLEKQVAALQGAGIRTPIYLSVQCDEWAANEHPEWIAMNGLEQVKFSDGMFAAGWQIMDMSSPYQDYLGEQIDEVIARFAPLDGLFLDMCWDQLSTSRWAVAAMRRDGLDPRVEADRWTHARNVVHQYMGRYQAQVEPHLGDDVASGVWFNSRPKTALGEETSYLRHIEIEALPSGGWGYSFFPYTARYVRPLGLPTLSHTGRFHKSWGDNGGIKPAAALRYETAQILAQGLTLGVGDVLSPDGTLNEAAYDLIGDSYAHAKECEPHLVGAEILTEAALLIDPELGDNPGSAGIGALRALQQAHVQFDIVSPESDLSAYSLLVVPESTKLTVATATALAARADAGASLLISRGADHGDDPQAHTILGFELGSALPFSTTFLRPADALDLAWKWDPAVYRRGVEVRAEGTVLCELVAPYFEREWDRFSGHSYTPSSGDVIEGAPAAVQIGQTIVTGVPLLASVAEDAAPAHRELINALVRRLLPQQLVTAGGPKHLETTLMSTPSATVLHLISYVATRAAELDDLIGLPHAGLDLVEDPFPLVDVPVAVRTDRAVRSATLEPGGRPVDYRQDGDVVTATVTSLTGHSMLTLHH